MIPDVETNQSESSSLVVDVAWPVFASDADDSMPVDHGFVLFSALSQVLPWVHSNPEVGIHPLGGRLIGDRRMRLTETTQLVLRLPASAVREVLDLSGKPLDIDGCRLQVGTPSVRALRPSQELVSRLVTIKNALSANALALAASRELAALGIVARVSIPTRAAAGSFEQKDRVAADPYVRRTLRVRDRLVVGYALHVEDLDPSDSVRLQARGIGGRRRFGCGIFVPARPQT
ncbi:MAG: type I-MYXAN CRISPR-associated protein Cas6/Cmx6 [Dehalococcoidia bacterium]